MRLKWAQWAHWPSMRRPVGVNRAISVSLFLVVCVFLSRRRCVLVMNHPFNNFESANIVFPMYGANVDRLQILDGRVSAQPPQRL